MLHVTLLIVLTSLLVLVASPAVAQVRVRLKNGGFVAGQMVKGDSGDGYIAIQSPIFDSPIELDVQAINSIDPIEREARKDTGKQTLILSNGTTLSGELVQLDDNNVTIKSQLLGQVTFPRQQLAEISDTSLSGRLVYSGPRAGREWNTDKPEDWAFEAGSIATSKAGASIIGDVNLPDRSEVRFSLSWSRKPDFILSLGCQKNEKDSNTAALRLEIWDGQLAMVREVGKTADLAMIYEIAPETIRLNLVVYLDQIHGVAAVCTPQGVLLDKIELKSEKVTPSRLVKLSNHSQDNLKSVLRLEKFEIRDWDGKLPESHEGAAEKVLMRSGESLTGKIAKYDATSGELEIDSESGMKKIKLADLKRAIFFQPKADQETADKAAKEAVEANDDPMPNEVPSTIPNPFAKPVEKAEQVKKNEDTRVEVELADSSRLIGRWKEIKAGKVTFDVEGVPNPIEFDLTQMMSMTGNMAIHTPPALPGEKSRLLCAECELQGCLVASESASSKLHWLSESSAHPVPLSENSQGKLEFTPAKPVARASQAMDASDLQGRRAVRILPRQNTAQAASPSMRHRSLSIGLEFRSGDVIGGTVTSINEAGVTFASENTKTTFVPHAQMTSITMRAMRETVNETPQKLERLMIVPRSMKQDPPTHLIVSTNGDYLRGRLISLNTEKAVLEIRLESTEIPTPQIAQIFWLHDREWDKNKEKVDQDKQADHKPLEPKPESSKFQVHAIRKDGRGITFAPTSMSKEKLAGKSDLLGDCEVELAQLQMLLFGRDVGAQARALKKEMWKLSLAILPKVFQEGEEGSTENPSPLVGKLAPNFKLACIDDSTKELAKYVGKVVVLDFWASWCGPCVKAMPEVDRIVKEVGENQVELIAVNVQESKDRVATAVGRLGITATVLLDTDGEVSAKYEANAIPQTVIIDRQGNVTHLFVGGGNKFLKDFETALKTIIEAKQ
jgi:thiol-disulfide isomerase/thioredoxin